ncbi:hypothetical protein CW304_22110 [Bacillus sp. UFRGS-B20]|nr:hypothetical protein CW304_22110 [Bacillus sp. UFRGS-B20]
MKEEFKTQKRIFKLDYSFFYGFLFFFFIVFPLFFTACFGLVLSCPNFKWKSKEILNLFSIPYYRQNISKDRAKFVEDSKSGLFLLIWEFFLSGVALSASKAEMYIPQ